MKKRILSAALALCLTGLLGAPAWGEGARPRLTEATLSVDGQAALRYTCVYEKDGAGPIAVRMEPLGGQAGVPATVFTYGYDGQGRLTEERSVLEGEEADAVRSMTYTYDEAGRLVREQWHSDVLAGGDGAVTDYVYDQDGRLVRAAEADRYGIVRYMREYDCDQAGRVTADRLYHVMDWDEAGEPTLWQPYPVNERRYTYDQDGRVTSDALCTGGAPDTETAYAYGEDPLFTLRWGEERDYLNGGEERFCELLIQDAAGRAVLCFRLTGTPTLIRDEAGRLAEAQMEGRRWTFSYAGD